MLLWVTDKLIVMVFCQTIQSPMIPSNDGYKANQQCNPHKAKQKTMDLKIYQTYYLNDMGDLWVPIPPVLCVLIMTIWLLSRLWCVAKGRSRTLRRIITVTEYGWMLWMYGEDHMWTYQGYRIALLYGSLDFFSKIHRYSVAVECCCKNIHDKIIQKERILLCKQKRKRNLTK